MKRILLALCLCTYMHLTAEEIDTWSSPPDTISSTGVNSSNPRVGMDENGNVVAVWIENDVVVSKTKLLGGSWSTATTLSSTGSTDPQLVVDPTSGDATAIWEDSGAIKTKSKPFGSAWGSTTTLALTGSSSPQIAIDSSTGDVVAVWVTAGLVESKTKLFGGIWSLVADTLSSANSAAPQIAIGSEGTAVVTWHTLNGISSIYNVNSANKLIGGLWSTATIVSDPAFNSVYPQVAVDQDGNALAVWFRYNLNGSIYSNVFLQSSTLPSAGSWSTPVDVSTDAGIRNPANLASKVILNGSTSGLAIWTNSVDGSAYSICSSGTTDLIHWDAPSILDRSIYSYGIDATNNSIGDAFGIYMTYDSGSDSVSINTTESRVGGTNEGYWTNSVQISDNANNGFPQIKSVITSGTDCNAIAAWVSSDGSNTIIQASTGTGTLVEPPSSLSVAQLMNDREVFQEYYNVLSWTGSPDPNLVAYGIYRNGLLIGALPASEVSYIDSDQPQNGPVTYGVSALDNAGTESAIITATFP